MPIYLRRSNGICTKIIIDSAMTLSHCYQVAQLSLKLDMPRFILYFQGAGLNREDSRTTLQEIDIRANTIVDVLEIDE